MFSKDTLNVWHLFIALPTKLVFFCWYSMQQALGITAAPKEEEYAGGCVCTLRYVCVV